MSAHRAAHAPTDLPSYVSSSQGRWHRATCAEPTFTRDETTLCGLTFRPVNVIWRQRPSTHASHLCKRCDAGEQRANDSTAPALAAVIEVYRGNTSRLLSDVADHLGASVAYVDRDTIEAHLGRGLSDTEWSVVGEQFEAMDFDDHVGEHATLRTDWIETLLDKAGVPGYGYTADGQPVPGTRAWTSGDRCLIAQLRRERDVARAAYQQLLDALGDDDDADGDSDVREEVIHLVTAMRAAAS